MKDSSNFQKHTATNPVQAWLIGRFYDRLLQMIDDVSPQTILDAGCGEGFTLNKIQSRWPGRFKLEGVDVWDEAVKEGKRRNPGISFKEGSVMELPYHDNEFDAVLCNEVLEHVSEPGKALAEVQRVASSYVILSVPREPMFRMANLLRGKDIGSLGNNTEHIQHWSSRGFGAFVENSDLKIEREFRPFPWTLVTARVGR